MRMRKLTTVLGLALAACGAAEADPVTPDPEEPTMMVIRVLVDVQPDQTEAFVAHLAEEAPQVRALDGCERFELFVDPSAPNRFLLYEEWASAEAFEAYQGSALLRESFAVLGPMMAGPPQSAYYAASREGP